MTNKKMADPEARHEVLSRTNADASTCTHSAADSRTFILEVQKNNTERLRVSVSEYRGRTFVDLRVWYVGEDGSYRPSSRGVTIRPVQVAEIVQGLMLAARAADPQGAR
jgi:hypothetical protein